MAENYTDIPEEFAELGAVPAEFADLGAVPAEQVTQPVPYKEKPSVGTSALKGAQQGVTFGMSDELGAGLGALLQSTLSPVTDEEKKESYLDRLSRLYQEELGSERQALKEAEEAHPGAYIAGDIAGGFAAPIGAITKGAKVAGETVGLGKKSIDLFKAGEKAKDLSKARELAEFAELGGSAADIYNTQKNLRNAQKIASAAKLKQTLAKGAAIGGGLGAIQGYGRSEGETLAEDLGNAVKFGVGSAILGAPLQVAGEKLIEAAPKSLDKAKELVDTLKEKKQKADLASWKSILSNLGIKGKTVAEEQARVGGNFGENATIAPTLEKYKIGTSLKGSKEEGYNKVNDVLSDIQFNKIDPILEETQNTINKKLQSINIGNKETEAVSNNINNWYNVREKTLQDINQINDKLNVIKEESAKILKLPMKQYKQYEAEKANIIKQQSDELNRIKNLLEKNLDMLDSNIDLAHQYMKAKVPGVSSFSFINKEQIANIANKQLSKIEEESGLTPAFAQTFKENVGTILSKIDPNDIRSLEQAKRRLYANAGKFAKPEEKNIADAYRMAGNELNEYIENGINKVNPNAGTTLRNLHREQRDLITAKADIGASEASESIKPFQSNAFTNLALGVGTGLGAALSLSAAPAIAVGLGAVGTKVATEKYLGKTIPQAIMTKLAQGARSKSESLGRRITDLEQGIEKGVLPNQAASSTDALMSHIISPKPAIAVASAVPQQWKMDYSKPENVAKFVEQASPQDIENIIQEAPQAYQDNLRAAANAPDDATRKARMWSLMRHPEFRRFMTGEK